MKPIVTLWLLLFSLVAYSQTELTPDKTYTPSNLDYTVLSADKGTVYGNNGNSFVLVTQKFYSYPELRGFSGPTSGLFYYEVWLSDRIEFWRSDFVDKSTPDNNNTTLIGVGGIRYKRYLTSLSNPQTQEFKGTWNASTNQPGLSSTPAANGAYYIVNTSGTQSITGKSEGFEVGDRVISNGVNWVKIRDALVDGSVSEGKIAENAVSTPKLSLDLQKKIAEIPNRWLNWVSTNEIVWDLTGGFITLPAGQGFWASDRQFYGKDLNLTSIITTAVTIPVPTTGDIAGLNYFFADLESKQYYVVNYRQRASVPAGSYLIATWYDSNINTISYLPAKVPTRTELTAALSGKADKATTIAGYGITNAYTKTETDLLNYSASVQFIGNSRINFDFTNRKIVIPDGFWSYRKSFFRNLGTINVDMPASGSSLGINALFVKFVTANTPTYYCVNYTAFNTVPDDAICVAAWYNATGQGLSFAGEKVNRSEVYSKTEIDVITSNLETKLPLFVALATYADFAALANPTTTTFYLIGSDEYNNSGSPSIYSKTSTGEIFWFAAQKMN